MQRHIADAERIAHARDVSGLDPLRGLVRGLLLGLLARYRAEGVFPQNVDFEGERRPYFVDARGVRCAMAHLLEMGGEGALVERIARERNNAYVRELADEPRLIAWLEAAGLTVEEAAAIQPSYTFNRADCLCGEGFGMGATTVPSVAVFEAVTLAARDPTSSIQTLARVERVYGDGAAVGIRVGDTVQLSVPFDTAAGTRVLGFSGRPGESITWVGVRDAGNPNDAGSPNDAEAPQLPVYRAAPLTAAGTFTCRGRETHPEPEPLGIEEVASLVSNSPSDCRARVTSAHPSWVGSTSSGGCRVAPGAHPGAGLPDTLGILVALVGAVSARRVVRACASRAARS